MKGHPPKSKAEADDEAIDVRRNWRPEYSGRKTLVLCFDGTGNKFTGQGGDSNIIKIFSMLDKQDLNQHVYYQPGIGTYVQSKKFSHTGKIAKIRSWYTKAKDSAIGTSFEQHVMGGYKFLMRYYTAGDDLYFFGFSRGAYTARFLAQMLDCVGLLAAGNEELLRFAWKTFAQWQTREEGTREEKEKKLKTYEFMKRFRQTFSIPVRRIRFLGLFDTVNSVPRFENKFMQRSKFPYTAKSSAIVIRHAVSIDERRAKFRQDLISQKKPSRTDSDHVDHVHMDHLQPSKSTGHDTKGGHIGVSRRPEKDDRFQPRKRHPSTTGMSDPLRRGSHVSIQSIDSQTAIQDREQERAEDSDDDNDETAEQDIEEIWFAGCHADIGGGWPLVDGEDISISHAPLIWMIREARKAGLPFDEDALKEAEYVLDDAFGEPYFHDASETLEPEPRAGRTLLGLPTFEVDGVPIENGGKAEPKPDAHFREAFFDRIMTASTKGHLHDVLKFGNGATTGGTLSWNMMEWLPFRRMDLRPDGSWKAIRWPLPRGETRDIPADAWIHGTVLKRMEADPTYRPGNLIVGGGGVGVRVAPEDVGIGKWKTLRDGDLVDHIVVRATPAGNLEELLEK